MDDISEYAKEAISYMYHKGIVNGVGYNSFEPKGMATRSQVCAVIERILNQSQMKGRD